MSDAACEAIVTPFDISSDTTKVVLGCAFFIMFILVNSIEIIPFLPVGRGGSTMLVASLMVGTGVIPVDTFYNAIACNLPLLLLVWGTMIIANVLETQVVVCTTIVNPSWSLTFFFCVKGNMVSMIFWWMKRIENPSYALVL